MRNIPRRSMDRIDQEINVSPLIDVVFILLIFFIVSATFVSVPGIEVNPKGADRNFTPAQFNPICTIQ